MHIYHANDGRVMDSTHLCIDAGDSKSNPDSYTVVPIADDVAVVTDSYVEGDDIYYDVVMTKGAVRRLSLQGLCALSTDYLVVHAVYVVKLALATSDDKWERRRLQRLYDAECVRLRKIKPTEEACRARLEADKRQG